MHSLRNESIRYSLTGLLLLGQMVYLTNTAYADAPVPWQIGFQDPATPVMEAIIDLHHQIFFFLIMIGTFVGWMLFRILWLFDADRNPVPSNVTHGSTIEILWTISPAVVLLLIAIPSFDMLYATDEVIDPAITVKAIGHQWYWSYEYSDYVSENDESLAFDSYMVPEEDLTEGQLRLLEVDNRVILPTDTHIRVVITATDVLHSWAVPSLGVKMDAVPGRLNQVGMFIQREGVYYGQCSELCGVNNGFMPIVVEAVSVEDYMTWIKDKTEISEIIEAI